MYVPRRIGTARPPELGPLLLGDRRQKQATLTQMLMAATDRKPTSKSCWTLSRHSSEAAASARPRAEAVFFAIRNRAGKGVQHTNEGNLARWTLTP